MTTLDSKQSTMRARQRTKRCSACTRTKPVTEFYASADYADGYWAKCKECVRKRNGAYKQRKRARLPIAAPPTECLVETAPERPQGQQAPGNDTPEPAPTCLCSLVSVVKDGHRLYATNPACPLPEHKRVIGGYEPHKAQKSGAQVKYNGMVYGY